MPSSQIPQSNSQGTEINKIQYVGMMWDEYNPRVESQMMRDTLAMLDAGRNLVDEVVICCESDKPDNMLRALGVRRVPTGQLAKLWIVYKVTEYFQEAPEWADEVIQRDMWLRKGRKDSLKVLDEGQNTGFYLPPQGRICPDVISLDRPAPNGYIPTNPSIFLYWG